MPRKPVPVPAELAPAVFLGACQEYQLTPVLDAYWQAGARMAGLPGCTRTDAIEHALRAARFALDGARPPR